VAKIPNIVAVSEPVSDCSNPFYGFVGFAADEATSFDEIRFDFETG
jgi:hypothetical protein